MKLDDVILFCEREQVYVTFYTDAGDITYWWKGWFGGPNPKADWGGLADVPSPKHQEALNKTQKFKVIMKDGSEKELSREEFEKLLLPAS